MSLCTIPPLESRRHHSRISLGISSAARGVNIPTILPGNGHGTTEVEYSVHVHRPGNAYLATQPCDVFSTCSFPVFRGCSSGHLLLALWVRSGESCPKITLYVVLNMSPTYGRRLKGRRTSRSSSLSSRCSQRRLFTTN